MDLMRLFMRIALIARRRQPAWKLAVIAAVVALFAVAGLVEWFGFWPDWLKADRPRLPRL